jgi:stage III sporulation protein AH
MLTLMVVLSAYYLFNGSKEPDYATLNDLIGQSQEQDADQQAENLAEDGANEGGKTAEENGEDDGWIDTISQLNGKLDEIEFSMEETGDSSDFFVAYRLERDEQRAEKMEEYQSRMNRPDATAQTVAEAQSNIEALWDQEEIEYTLENMLKEEGYSDALIIHNQNGGITVLVESDQGLDRKEVLNIIHLVHEQTNVPGNMITVKYR